MFKIHPFQPEPSDYQEIGDRLGQFTLEAIGPYPTYGPQEFAFNAVDQEGRIVGRVIATAIFDEDVEVVLLHVESDCRGLRVGERLMRKIEDEARAIQAHGIRTWTPTIHGDGFYQRLGYKEFFRVPLKKMSKAAKRPCFNHFFYKSLEPTEE